VSSFRLAPADGEPLPAALPGQFLTLRLRRSPEDAPLIRTYSLSGAPGAAGYRISVKREPHGAGSTYLHDEVRVGQTIECAAPRGTFILRRGENPVVLVSAGVGATPVLAMLHALATEPGARPVWWLQSARNRAEHPFADESRRLLASLPGAHGEFCYSQPGDDDRPGDDYTIRGRLSADTLGRLAIPADASVYLCGPVGFMDQVSAELAGLGIDPARIYTERFAARAAITPGIATGESAAPHAPAGPIGTGPAVSFARSNLTVDWGAGYESLLEFAEACAVPVQWSCRTGVCHTCETAVFSGSVVYSPEPVDRPGEGNVLVCCSRPLEDLVLDL
jgi:ferredoxin-NADP reductase